jgi:hypothetical protein
MTPNDLITKSDLAKFGDMMLASIEEKLNILVTASHPKQSDKLLTRAELIAYLDISENTFTELQEKGLPYISVGKRARYEKSAVMNFLKKI